MGTSCAVCVSASGAEHSQGDSHASPAHTAFVWPPLQPWARGCSLIVLTGAVQAPCLLRLRAAFIYTAAASSEPAKNKRLALSKQIAFSASSL